MSDIERAKLVNPLYFFRGGTRYDDRQRKCPECGHVGNRPQPYCSPTCRDRARGLMRKPKDGRP
jgi:hypothetical protein